MTITNRLTVGVLALQGAFSEHIQLLRQAAISLSATGDCTDWHFSEVRTAVELDACDALIIPGGESTTISLVAERSGILNNLREFVKVKRKPTWGTCAGLILLAESANKTKKGGQELIGGLDVRVNRNHFGRQVESFTADVDLPFLRDVAAEADAARLPFHAVFIRAPVVERTLHHVAGIQTEEAKRDDTVVAPSRKPDEAVPSDVLNTEVEVMATLVNETQARNDQGKGDIIAVKQGNCFGTSFHPELTNDARIHIWWLKGVLESMKR